MSRAELYQWSARIGTIFIHLGRWQALGLALFSYGVVLARTCVAGQVAEKLALVGSVKTVQRRLERWLANERINWQVCCRAWSKFVLRQYVGERLILLVDETKLGDHLSAMVIGLAYRGCCIPLVFWCYPPQAWPMGQVHLIEELFSWLAEAIPDGVQPLVEADRGIGTSPDLVRVIEALGWQYLFRVQGQTRYQYPDGSIVAMNRLVGRGQHWQGTGRIFKKAGWLPATAHVIWDAAYTQPWCLITNCPGVSGRLYAVRFWQEASFRDLKSDGWQWQASHIFQPDHANLLLVVLSIAYAFMLSLGTLAFEEPSLTIRVWDKHTSLFRLGLRVWDALLGSIHTHFATLLSPWLVLLDPPPPRPAYATSLKTVGG